MNPRPSTIVYNAQSEHAMAVFVELAPVRAALLLSNIETEVIDVGSGLVARVRDYNERIDRELWISPPITNIDLADRSEWSVVVVTDQDDLLEWTADWKEPNVVGKIVAVVIEYLHELRT